MTAGMLLPDDIDISERSRRFYDGTYKLSANGFIDETGGRCRCKDKNCIVTDI